MSTFAVEIMKAMSTVPLARGSRASSVDGLTNSHTLG
jgi:hypothetical protein